MSDSSSGIIGSDQDLKEGCWTLAVTDRESKVRSIDYSVTKRGPMRRQLEFSTQRGIQTVVAATSIYKDRVKNNLRTSPDYPEKRTLFWSGAISLGSTAQRDSGS